MIIFTAPGEPPAERKAFLKIRAKELHCQPTVHRQMKIFLKGALTVWKAMFIINKGMNLALVKDHTTNGKLETAFLWSYGVLQGEHRVSVKRAMMFHDTCISTRGHAGIKSFVIYTRAHARLVFVPGARECTKENLVNPGLQINLEFSRSLRLNMFYFRPQMFKDASVYFGRFIWSLSVTFLDFQCWRNCDVWRGIKHIVAPSSDLRVPLRCKRL